MTVLLDYRFWAGLVLSVSTLSGVGVALAWLLVPAPPVYHRTTYMEFPLPEGWTCDEQGTETVCLPGPPPNSAIIVLTAKYRSDNDSLSFYESYLRQPRKDTDADGKEHVSTVLYVRRAVIGGYDWVDGRHFGSELTGYETRYLATTTSEIGVLITYSVKQDSVSTYDPVLDAMVRGLDIYQRSAGAL